MSLNQLSIKISEAFYFALLCFVFCCLFVLFIIIFACCLPIFKAIIIIYTHEYMQHATKQSPYQPFFLSVCLSVRSFIYLSVCLSVRVSTVSICLSVRLSVYLCVCLSVCLRVLLCLVFYFYVARLTIKFSKTKTNFEYSILSSKQTKLVHNFYC